MRATIFICFVASAFIKVTNAFVYSCNEIKHNLIPNVMKISTPYACVVGENRVNVNIEDMSYSKYVKSTFFKDATNATFSLHDVMNSNSSCVQGTAPWTISKNDGVEVDCKDEISVLYSSMELNIVKTRDWSGLVDSNGAEYVTIVSPVGAIQFTYQNSFPESAIKNDVKFYTGAGSGQDEEMFLMIQKPLSFPEGVNHYGPVMTVQFANGTDYQFGVSGTNNAPMMNSAGFKFTLVSSGYANDRQSLAGRNFHNLFDFGVLTAVNITGMPFVDDSTKTDLKFTCYPDVDSGTKNILEITNTTTISQYFECEALEIDYNGKVPEANIGRSSELILLYLSTDVKPTSDPTTTPKPNADQSTTSKPNSDQSTTTKSTGVLAYLASTILVLINMLLL